MNTPRPHGAATAFLLLLCAIGISIAAGRAHHAGPAGDDSPWPVDAVAVDPVAIAHDTETLAAQAREPHSRHASAASAVGAMPRH